MFKKKLLSVLLICAMVLSLIPSTMSEYKTQAATTWRSALYPENWTPGYTNSSGQFLHDFSYAGYEKGEKDVPTEMSGLYVNVVDYGADATGANDSTSAIQSAINAVQDAGGGTVYLPAGTYKVKPASNSNSSALTIKGSNILFKGAGVGKTFIRCYAESMRYCKVINVTNGGSWDSAEDGNTYYLSQDIPTTPTTTIHLSSVGSLKAGDWVIIRSDRTQSWIDEHSMGGFWYSTVNPTTMGTTFYRKITSVNAANNTIEIDIPTRYWMKTRDNARVYKVTPKQSNVGLMDFSIGNKANSITSGWGENDYSTSGNGAYAVDNAFLISFSLNVNCFAKNIATYQAGNASQIHMSSNGLNLSKTRNITIENCDFSYPQYEGANGNGYGINICGQETLIKDCSSTSARHSFSFKYSYANGNVIYHYTSTDPKYGSDFHMYLSMSNLIDNEELNGDYVESNIRPYGGTAGNRHGYTSTQTVFWNTKGNYYKSGMNYVIDSRQYGYGYIIGTQGAATAVKTTPTTMSSTYGTVDTAPEDYKEGIGSGSTLSPQSLYYDQLERRLNGGSLEPAAPKDIPGTINATEYSSATSEITTFTTSSGTKYVGNLVSGSSLEYSVNVAQAGKYKVELDAVSGNSNSNRQLSLYTGSTLLSTLDVINMTDWEDFQKISTIVDIPSAGEQTIKISSTGSVNIADIVFTKIDENTTEKTTEKSTEQQTTAITKSGSRVVGYLPSYRTSAINSIDFSALTHCCLAFMTYSGGTLTSGFSDSTVQNVVDKCHANDVKVMIAIGGGGGFNTSDNPFGTATSRTSIINQIMTYVDRLNLDGVDIDIEVTDSNTWSNFDAFCSELSGRLKAEDKLFTMAVSSWFTDPIANSTYNYFDFVNLMTYDAAFGDGEVAPWSQINNMVTYYGNRGISKERMTIGVPFYGYGSGAKDYTYAQILAMDSNNKNLDYYNGIYYNGEKTIREKAEYSKDYGGIMIWELGQDSFGSNSLLAAIKDVMQTETVVPVSQIPGSVSVNSYSDKSSSITITTENNVTYAGNLNDGTYLDYQVNIADIGDYTFHLNLAAGDTQYNAENMLIKLDGTTVATIPVQASSSWTTFIEHQVTVNLSQTGVHTLSIVADSGACNVADFTVEKYEKPTAEPETTTISSDTDPAEVFGVVVSSEADNTIGVVWGRNSEKEAIGQLYNVYVDGVKKLSKVKCDSYTISDVSAGTHTVKVTSVLGDKETEGYATTITVAGSGQTVTSQVKAEINGYQISTTVEGYRVVYSFSDPEDEIVSRGLVFGLADYATESELVVDSANNTVYSYEATSAGKWDGTVSTMDNASTYVMTTEFIKNKDFFSRNLMVRAYAELKDGSYVYSDADSFTVYNLADYLYQNLFMTNAKGHQYLYDTILTVVNPSYISKEYDYNNSIVK